MPIFEMSLTSIKYKFIIYSISENWGGLLVWSIKMKNNYWMHLK